MKKALVIISALVASVSVSGLATASSAGTSAPAAKKNIVQTAAAAGQFTTLLTLAKKAGLAGTLSSKRVTVLAPTDAAFAKVPKRTLDALAKDRKALRSVLLYHVIAGKAPSSRVVKLKSVKTLQGSKVKVSVRKGKVFLNTARVVTPDVMASNGVIHVINRVLLPPTS